MYTIIGGDGKEYGPVTTEQVQAWIAAGRANLETQAKALGTNEWKQLGDFPDFGGRGAEPPPLGGGGRETTAAHPLAPEGSLEVGQCYERSWNLLKANFWPFVGLSLLTMILAGAASVVVRAATGTLHYDLTDHAASFSQMFLKSFFLSMVEGFLITYPLTAGLYFYIIKKARGETASLGDIFAGFSRAYLPLVLGGFLVTVLTVLGLFCLIIPGIYLGLAYSLTPLILVDRKIGAWAAMEMSRRAITAHWWTMLGIVLLGVLLMFAGIIALIVGFFVVVPLLYGALVYAYLDLCPSPASSAPETLS